MDDQELRFSLAMESMRTNNGVFWLENVTSAYEWIKGRIDSSGKIDSQSEVDKVVKTQLENGHG